MNHDDPDRSVAPPGRAARPFLNDPSAFTDADEAGVAAGPVDSAGVRPYLLTGGRTHAATADLELEAQVVVTPIGRQLLYQLTFEHHDIAALCVQPTAVAEIGARLGLHLGVVRVLVGDLIELGYLEARRPDLGLHRNVDILERVIRGLQAIR